MATSGGISCPDADTRHSYYGNPGLPTARFNGGSPVVGAGAESANGSTYDPVVVSMLDDATEVMLTMDSHSIVAVGQSHVTLTVELTDDLDNTNTQIRVAVVENGLSYGGRAYEDIVRDLLPETALSINTAGQTQNFTVNFNLADMDFLDVNNMWIAAWVQRDTDKYIHQSCNSYPLPDYSFRYYSLGERVVVDAGVHEFGDFAVFNTGAIADTYDITLDASDLPGDWSGYFTDGVDTFTSTSVALAPGESAVYHVVMDAASTGSGTASLTMHSQNSRADDRVIGYSMITSDVEILLVDDDGADDYESVYFAPALATTGRSFAIWDRNAATITGSLMANFDAVVWNVGFSFPTLDADDRAAITDYTQGGGAFFVTGQDIGWDLQDQGGAAYVWYRETLGATFVSDDTNNYTLDGVPGDPITDGISVQTSGGDGANNQEYPSDIDPWGGNSTVIFTYDANRNGAVKLDDGVYRSVYLSFGFEAINNAADRALVMQRIINWLIPDLTGVQDGAPGFALHLQQNSPNPFNPNTKIDYSLGEAGPISLEVFDLEGRLIRVLDEGMKVAGDHSATWDGKDGSGSILASGVYFYRLSKADDSETRKMMLLK